MGSEPIMQRLCDCISSLTLSDNMQILMFNPAVGGYSLEYSEGTLGYDYRLTIPTEENRKRTVIFDDENLKKLSICCGIGSKHFDVLFLKPDKIIDALNQMFSVSDLDFYFLLGNKDIVVDVAVNTEPVKVGDLLDVIKNWYKSGSNDSDPMVTKDWSDSELDESLVIHYFNDNNGVITIGFGIKHRKFGGLLKCNRLGSVKTTIYPCYFKIIDEKSIPIIFDIKGITECKPFFKKNTDISTNVSTILGESEDFLYENQEKFSFKLARDIEPESYLKHLAMEAKIPKKYLKKEIIKGLSIKEIVDSICNECYKLLYKIEETDDVDLKKNYSLFEKLSKAAGYAVFYQNRFCNCCFKAKTLAEDK